PTRRGRGARERRRIGAARGTAYPRRIRSRQMDGCSRWRAPTPARRCACRTRGIGAWNPTSPAHAARWRSPARLRSGARSEAALWPRWPTSGSTKEPERSTCGTWNVSFVMSHELKAQRAAPKRSLALALNAKLDGTGGARVRVRRADDELGVLEGGVR